MGPTALKLFLLKGYPSVVLNQRPLEKALNELLILDKKLLSHYLKYNEQLRTYSSLLTINEFTDKLLDVLNLQIVDNVIDQT